MTRWTVNQLIDPIEPSWPDVQRWLKSAKNKLEILPADKASSDAALEALQISTRLPLAAIVHDTGGILVDGWVRVLGGGCPRLPISVPGWNGMGGDGAADPKPEGFLVFAWDLSGGFFAINGGGLRGARGNVSYFSPEKLAWQDLGRSFSHFLMWLFAIDLGSVYAKRRRARWREDAAACDGNSVLAIDPPLAVEDWPIEERLFAPTPVAQVWNQYFGEVEGGT